MKLSHAVAATLVVALSLPAAAFAAGPATNNDPKVFGRDKFDVQTSLADRGVNTTNVERWGQAIRAVVTNRDGTQSIQFFDKDSLQPVQADGTTIYNKAETGKVPYGRGEFGSSNVSLVE